MAPEASEPVLEPPPRGSPGWRTRSASRSRRSRRRLARSRRRNPRWRPESATSGTSARGSSARDEATRTRPAPTPPGNYLPSRTGAARGEGCAPAASSPRDPERPDPGPSSASPGIPGPSSPRVTRRRPRRPPPLPAAPLVRAGQGAYYPDGAQPRASLDAVARFLLGETIATHVDKAVGRDGDGPAKRKHVQRLVEETWRRPACALEMWRALGRRFADASTSSIVALRIVAVAHEVARRGSPAAPLRGRRSRSSCRTSTAARRIVARSGAGPPGIAEAPPGRRAGSGA